MCVRLDGAPMVCMDTNFCTLFLDSGTKSEFASGKTHTNISIKSIDNWMFENKGRPSILRTEHVLQKEITECETLKKHDRIYIQRKSFQCFVLNYFFAVHRI